MNCDDEKKQCTGASDGTNSAASSGEHFAGITKEEDEFSSRRRCRHALRSFEIRIVAV
jgi:hypothetical protein